MNNELLKRIEKLEQAVQDIWAACSCLRKDLDTEDIDMPNRECGELPEEPEEPENIFECPGSACVECGQFGFDCVCFLNEEKEEPDDTIYCPGPTEEEENDHE